jgi:two-component system, OmpR family, KDP operon response regulator KdpE
MTRILLIDDDVTVLATLEKALKNQGYQVFTASSSQTGLEIARKQLLDLVILDMVMPKTNCYEVIQRLHELGIISILILGPRNDERSVVKCLEMGADDYLSKPVAVPILLARIRMLMRRNNQHVPVKPPTYDDGKLLIDLNSRRVEVRGKPIKLTRTEFRLLSILLHRAGRVVTHEDLINEIWGTEKETSLGSLKLYIHYLRQKIEDHPKQPYYLLAEWGIGYRLRKPKNEATMRIPANINGSSVPLYQPAVSFS